MTPFRIALVYWGRRGGGARMTVELLGALSELAAVVPTASVSSSCECYDEIRRRTTELHTARTPASWRSVVPGLPGLVANWIGLGRWLDRTRPDVVLVVMGSPWLDVAARWVHRRARRVGARVVRVVHDAERHPGDRWATPAVVARHAERRADAYVVLSDHVGAQLVGRGVSADRIVRSELGPFDVGPVLAPAEPHDPLRVLFFGRIAPYKGVDVLLEAARRLPPQARVEVRVVGAGSVGDAAVPPCVSVEDRWVAEREIPDLLEWADVVVLPYVEASQSGVAPMAIAKGLPVVASAIGGLGEQVDDGRTGLLVPPGDADALARALARLATEPGRYARLRATTYAASGELGWGGIADRLVVALRELDASQR